MATATGCVPTAIGGFGAGGMSVGEGATATLMEAEDGKPFGTSVFWTSMGNSPGVEKGKFGADNVTCNWRLFTRVAGSVWVPDVTRVDDEKYPPFKLRVPEVVDEEKLSGAEAITSGCVGCTASEADWLVSPFCRCTVIDNEVGV